MPRIICLLSPKPGIDCNQSPFKPFGGPLASKTAMNSQIETGFPLAVKKRTKAKGAGIAHPLACKFLSMVLTS
jgi:hypothetical protein